MPFGGGSVGATGAGGATDTGCVWPVSGSYVISTSVPVPVPTVEIKTFPLNPTATPCGLASSCLETDEKLAEFRSMMSSVEPS